MHDYEVAQETSSQHCTCTCDGSCVERRHVAYCGGRGGVPFVTLDCGRPKSIARSTEDGALHLHGIFSKFKQRKQAPGRQWSVRERWPIFVQSSVYCPPPARSSQQRSRCAQCKGHRRNLQFCEICSKAWRICTYLLISRTVCFLVAAFLTRMEELKDGVVKTEELNVAQKPFFYSGEQGNYKHGAWLKRLWRTNVGELAVSFQRKKSSLNGMLASVCYSASGDLKSTHSGWTNQLSNVSRLLHAERLFWIGFTEFGSKALLRPDHKNKFYMKDTICKYTLPGGLNKYCCSGTFSVPKRCMLLPHHWQFVGCNLYI